MTEEIDISKENLYGEIDKVKDPLIKELIMRLGGWVKEFSNGELAIFGLNSPKGIYEDKLDGLRKQIERIEKSVQDLGNYTQELNSKIFDVQFKIKQGDK